MFTSLAVFILFSFVSAQDFQDYEPEVSARVARVKILIGEASILRKEARDWEKVVTNLPLVEGDEIVLENDSRMEIQLDSWNFIRLDGKARMKMTTLNEDGVAVSLIAGSMSVRIGKMDGDGKFFEMDAPGTTISVQKTGLFDLDSTDSVAGRVRLSVSDDGEARVYSETSGFTIRSGRSATLFLVGARKGEWDLADFSGTRNDFSKWVASRDQLIAKKLEGAYFDRYYDTDFYGADDLNDYGTWVDTSDYGTVWRPHRTTTRVYADWSPYRYGHWRWIPPYGWTWVNDEPWGWVTYHHGRWVFISGYWHWAPYPHPSYRWKRSWWKPAFVSFYYYGGSVCWYPLPYYSRYNDFNRIHYSRWSNRSFARNSRRRPRNVINIVNVPRDTSPRREQVPNRGVIVVDKDRFGRTTRPGRNGDDDVMRRINSTIAAEGLPVIPEMDVPERRDGSDIISRRPSDVGRSLPRIGATERTDDSPVDSRLRRGRIFGDRTPLEVPERTMPVDETTPEVTPPRGQRPGTGVVARPERTPEGESPRRNSPRDGSGDRNVIVPRPDRSPNDETRPAPDRRAPGIGTQPRGEERESDRGPGQSPRFETPRRAPRVGPTPDSSPRTETPRPSPSPEQGPRFGSPRRPSNPQERPRSETPRSSPSPEQGPRFGSPRQSPRNESPRPVPAPPSRKESRPAPPSRREPPRVTAPPRSDSSPRKVSPPRESPPSRDSRQSPERSRDQMEMERDG